MLQVKLFLVLLGAITTTALLDNFNVSKKDNIKDEKISQFLPPKFFFNKTRPQKTRLPGEERSLLGATDITDLQQYEYMVAVLSNKDLITTGIAINHFWILINPVFLISLIYDKEEVIRLLNPDDLMVYAGEASPVTSGVPHKVKQYKPIPSAPKYGNLYDSLALLRICRRLQFDIFPIIPNAPISVGVSGDIVAWQSQSILGKITKVSAAMSAQCSSLGAALGGATSKMFCTVPDLLHTVKLSGNADPHSSPFITSGDTFIGSLLVFAENGFEIFLDLSYFKTEIENLAPKYPF